LIPLLDDLDGVARLLKRIGFSRGAVETRGRSAARLSSRPTTPRIYANLDI
jgi:hypothetical protein